GVHPHDPPALLFYKGVADGENFVPRRMTRWIDRPVVIDEIVVLADRIIVQSSRGDFANTLHAFIMQRHHSDGLLALGARLQREAIVSSAKFSTVRLRYEFFPDAEVESWFRPDAAKPAQLFEKLPAILLEAKTRN